MVDPAARSATPEALDDADYPAYTMGRAAEMLGVTPDFLRSLGPAGLLDPNRSSGGHRRYSRRELDLAARVRALLDEDSTSLLVVACRLARAEADLDSARQRLAEMEHTADSDRAARKGDSLMVRHRRDDADVEPAAEVDPADRLDQHHPTDPVELADDADRTALDTPMPGEADPVDATEQAEAVAVDDELRAEAPGVRISAHEVSE